MTSIQRLSVQKARENGILVITASIIAVIRLRGEPITRSPKVVATISNSVQLARMVLEKGGGERVRRGRQRFPRQTAAYFCSLLPCVSSSTAFKTREEE